MMRYRVVFVYAPIPNKEFRTIEEALDYQKSRSAKTRIEKKNLFGKWMPIKD